MKIAIDLGHGAKPYDTGAVGILNEEDEVRKISPFMVKRLQELGHTVKVINIKSCTSVTNSLQQRCDAANNWGADLFISMHLNAYQNTDKAMGCEVLALSKKAFEIADDVEDAIAGLGFKSRGVKADRVYVLINTDMPAILIESFFIDSVADTDLYQKIGAEKLGVTIADGIHGKVAPNPIPNPTTDKPRILVKDIIGKCDTSFARGLSIQVITKINRMVPQAVLVEVRHELIDTSSPAVNPFLQPQAFKALVAAVTNRGAKMKINSCYRTAVQQHILKQQLEKGCCGLTAVAMPGKSNHECGLAIDIEDAEGWKPYLEAQGWSWIGSFDPMHFDFWNGRTDLGRIGIAACQLLHNEHNKQQLAVDRSYGPATAAAINNMPCGGY